MVRVTMSGFVKGNAHDIEMATPCSAMHGPFVKTSGVLQALSTCPGLWADDT